MSAKVSGQESAGTTRGQRLAAYVSGTLNRKFPPEVLDAAKRALVDYLGVAVGASEDAPVRPVRRAVQGWKAAGNARIFLGGRTTPALVTAGKLDPRTPLEGKFSVPFCIALGLRGYRAAASDFNDATMRDASVMEVVPIVALEAVHGQAPHAAHLDVFLDGGERLHADTDIVIGHPDNPMSWEDLRTRFDGRFEPILGPQKTAMLCETARRFDQPGSLRKITDLLESLR